MTIRQLNITQLPDFKTADYQTIISNRLSPESILMIKPPQVKSVDIDRILKTIREKYESGAPAIIANGVKIN